jgi:hypothetical protein
VQADDLDAENVSNQTIEHGPGAIDQLLPHLLQQVPAALPVARFGELDFRLGEDAFQPDYDQVIHKVRFRFDGSATHILLFKANRGLADFGFGFANGLSSQIAQGGCSYDSSPPGSRAIVPASSLRNVWRNNA